MKLSKSATHYDIIIAGAGVSGLFAAWRLLREKEDLKILMIDKLGRTGGRLQTTTVPIKYPEDGQTYLVKDEEGGMRFNSGMPYVSKLIDEMKLKKVPFEMDYAQTNRLYFRGKAFTIAETPAIWNLLYRLADAESNQSPGTVIMSVLAQILKQNPDFTFTGEDGVPATPLEWQEFRNKCTYEGYVINQWGFWALMRTAGLTEECIDWLKNVIGFMGPTQSCINAGESLQILCDFPNVPDFDTLANGIQSVPDSLVKNIEDKVSIHLNETVVKIAQEGSGNGMQVETDKQSYTCSKVILAVPAKALQTIISNSPFVQSFPTAFHDAVNSVQNMELTKVGLYFNQRWWHRAPINLTCGPSFNDLPLGTVYCFKQFPDNSKEEQEKDQNYYGPAALTIYNDYDRGSFWKEMQNIGGMYNGSIPQPANTYAASIALVQEALRQIKLLMGLKETDFVPQPVLSTYRVWGAGEFGYGYHQYKLNVDDTTQVYPHIWNPHPDVFVCNESWSPEQGWIEGALISSDYVLTKGFNLKPYYSYMKR